MNTVLELEHLFVTFETPQGAVHAVQDVDLTKFDQPVKRHDGTNAPPVKDRPGTGHIGFQHLSRNNEPVLYRNVRLKELK